MFFSSEINSNGASHLLESEWCRLFDENNHKPPELSCAVLEDDGM